MSESLSYPIGQFIKPEKITSEIIVKWIDELAALPAQMESAVEGLSEEQLNTAYRPGGWTIKQVINHVPDSHISSYMRFHWTLTESNPTIKAYDEKAWATLPYHDEMPIAVSLELLAAVHQRWVFLLKTLSETDLEKTFVHPENGETLDLKTTIGSYAWHGKHHLAHITNLKKRMGW
jgi:uncharacterized damage-inducible protein DinB